jgi:hypothetical protein
MISVLCRKNIHREKDNKLDEGSASRRVKDKIQGGY